MSNGVQQPIGSEDLVVCLKTAPPRHAADELLVETPNLLPTVIAGLAGEAAECKIELDRLFAPAIK